MSAYIVVKCPTCNNELTVHHPIDSSPVRPLYVCQECNNQRTLKPSEMLAAGASGQRHDENDLNKGMAK